MTSLTPTLKGANQNMSNPPVWLAKLAKILDYAYYRMASMFDGDMILKIVAILVVIGIAVYIIDPTMMGFLRPRFEGFQDAKGSPAGPGGSMPSMPNNGGMAQNQVETAGAKQKKDEESNAHVAKFTDMSESKEGFEDSPADFGSAAAPAGCYPRDQLTPAELLPKDPNSVWAQQNPMGNGSLKGKNFLSAGALIGVNTVGQSLRNANYQLRSEPPNPQMPVSIFNQSTIEPDVNRRALEIA
jgi:hypothetical protein